MKKFLLSLLCLASLTAANATDATVDLTTGYANQEKVSSVIVDDNVTITLDKGTGSTDPAWYNTGTGLRLYKNGVMTIAGNNSSIIINSVTVTASGASYAIPATSAVSSGTISVTDAVTTITGVDAQSLSVTLADIKHTRMQSITVSYTMGEVTQASVPTITPNGGEVTADSKIELACATEGASIYYTIDGTEPSTSSNLYSAPFSLSAAATVKAIAVKEGLTNSSVASADFTFPVANIAEFISEARKHATSITGAVTVVAQAGSYLFLQDATSRIVAFGSLTNTYNNGDQLTNVKGTYTLYNGLPEMNVVDASFGTATAGTAVEPEVLAIEELSIDNLLAYVKIEGVTIPEGTGKSFNISDATSSVTMYNSAGIDIVSGENLTVVGFISCYNATLQILPIEITSASGLEVVEMPTINPNGGTIAKTQTIELACATEGASIYYTLNGDEPTTSSNLYVEPFTLDNECTVKAIAVKEGMENSSVAEAAFTFLSDAVKVATFDFTNPASLNPAQETPAASAGIEVNDIVFTADNISLVATPNSATTACRLWGIFSGGVDFRTYKTSTITISATDAKITSIAFTGGKASASQLTVDNGTLTGQAWVPADANAVNSVVFTTTATTNIETITVNYELAGSGVEDIIANDNAPVEYYNLQGVRVANPENGLYIRVQGNKASKVLVK